MKRCRDCYGAEKHKRWCETEMVRQLQREAWRLGFFADPEDSCPFDLDTAMTEEV